MTQIAEGPTQRLGATWQMRRIRATWGLLAQKDSSRQTDLEQQEVAVPADQRPVNELAALKQAWLYSWVMTDAAAHMYLLINESVLLYLNYLVIILQAVLPLDQYIKRLAILFTIFFTLIGAPISDQTFDASKQVRV
jgi:hypothetical protein